mgnify:CR=1 FL=1
MTRYSGTDARLGNVSGHQAGGVGNGSAFYMALVGDVEEFEVRAQGDTFDVPSLGNSYPAAIETAKVRPELEVSYHPQNTSFLHTYLIPNSAGNLSSHHMAYYANSADYGILFGALPQRVEVRFAKNSPVTVRFTDIGTNWSTGFQTSTGNFATAVSSTEPMMSEKLTSVRILDGATVIRDMTSLWRRGDFSIDYGTTPQYTGTTVTPSDVLQGVRRVRGSLEVSVNESAKLLPYVTNASYLNVEVGFQNAPMSSCYTFYSSVVRTNSVTVPGTDVQRQRIEFECRFVTRSSL